MCTLYNIYTTIYSIYSSCPFAYFFSFTLIPRAACKIYYNGTHNFCQSKVHILLYSIGTYNVIVMLYMHAYIL